MSQQQGTNDNKRSLYRFPDYKGLVLFYLGGVTSLWPRYHIFNFDLEIIKTNFQTNFQDIYIKTEANSVNKIFLLLTPVTLFIYLRWAMFKLIQAIT
jgi:hypothetical protein